MKQKMYIRFRWRKSFEIQPYERQRKPWENIKVDFQETGCKDCELECTNSGAGSMAGHYSCWELGVLLSNSWLLYNGNDNKDDYDSNKNTFCQKMLGRR
jgi:hypothetical protein